MTIHNCKCHGRPYTVCPDCSCQYCPDYWPACPRSSWHPSHTDRPLDRLTPSSTCLPVIYVHPDGSIYMRLSDELARVIEGGCSCEYCKEHPDRPPRWDTLIVTPKLSSHSWTVHAPDVQALRAGMQAVVNRKGAAL